MTAPSTFGDTNLRAGDFALPDAGAGDLDRAFLDIRSVHSLAPTRNASPACTRGRSVYKTRRAGKERSLSLKYGNLSPTLVFCLSFQACFRPYRLLEQADLD